MIKKWIFLIVLGIITFGVLAQEQSKDVIYLLNGNLFYPDKILDIHPGRIIYFEKDGERSTVSAKAINIEGTYVNLSVLETAAKYTPSIPLDSALLLNYNGKNYLYYLQTYTRSKRYIKTGQILTIVGLSGVFVGSIGVAALISVDGTENTLMMMVAIIPGLVGVFGIMAVSAGATFWIAGQNYHNNNKRAMDLCKKSSVSLGFGVNSNGIGLVLRF